jgi:hypothetical protein
MTWSSPVANEWKNSHDDQQCERGCKSSVRRNTEEVQGGGNFEVFEELFADDFLDHTPQPGRTPDKAKCSAMGTKEGPAFRDWP